MRKVVVTQLVRRRIQNISKNLRDRFGEEVAQKAVTSLVEAIEGLGQFPEKGIQISKMYRIDTEYYYLFFEHNYIVYRFNDKEVTILRLFDEKEDFMLTLFGLSGRTQESIDYWGD